MFGHKETSERVRPIAFPCAIELIKLDSAKIKAIVEADLAADLRNKSAGNMYFWIDVCNYCATLSKNNPNYNRPLSDIVNQLKESTSSIEYTLETSYFIKYNGYRSSPAKSTNSAPLPSHEQTTLAIQNINRYLLLRDTINSINNAAEKLPLSDQDKEVLKKINESPLQSAFFSQSFDEVMENFYIDAQENNAKQILALLPIDWKVPRNRLNGLKNIIQSHIKLIEKRLVTIPGYRKEVVLEPLIAFLNDLDSIKSLRDFNKKEEQYSAVLRTLLDNLFQTLDKAIEDNSDAINQFTRMNKYRDKYLLFSLEKFKNEHMNVSSLEALNQAIEKYCDTYVKYAKPFYDFFIEQEVRKPVIIKLPPNRAQSEKFVKINLDMVNDILQWAKSGNLTSAEKNALKNINDVKSKHLHESPEKFLQSLLIIASQFLDKDRDKDSHLLIMLNKYLLYKQIDLDISQLKSLFTKMPVALQHYKIANLIEPENVDQSQITLREYLEKFINYLQDLSPTQMLHDDFVEKVRNYRLLMLRMIQELRESMIAHQKKLLSTLQVLDNNFSLDLTEIGNLQIALKNLIENPDAHAESWQALFQKFCQNCLDSENQLYQTLLEKPLSEAEDPKPEDSKPSEQQPNLSVYATINERLRLNLSIIEAINRNFKFYASSSSVSIKDQSALYAINQYSEKTLKQKTREQLLVEFYEIANREESTLILDILKKDQYTTSMIVAKYITSAHKALFKTIDSDIEKIRFIYDQPFQFLSMYNDLIRLKDQWSSSPVVTMEDLTNIKIQYQTAMFEFMTKLFDKLRTEIQTNKNLIKDNPEMNELLTQFISEDNNKHFDKLIANLKNIDAKEPFAWKRDLNRCCKAYTDYAQPFYTFTLAKKILEKKPTFDIEPQDDSKRDPAFLAKKASDTLRDGDQELFRMITQATFEKQKPDSHHEAQAARITEKRKALESLFPGRSSDLCEKLDHFTRWIHNISEDHVLMECVVKKNRLYELPDHYAKNFRDMISILNELPPNIVNNISDYCLYNLKEPSIATSFQATIIHPDFFPIFMKAATKTHLYEEGLSSQSLSTTKTPLKDKEIKEIKKHILHIFHLTSNINEFLFMLRASATHHTYSTVLNRYIDNFGLTSFSVTPVDDNQGYSEKAEKLFKYINGYEASFFKLDSKNLAAETGYKIALLLIQASIALFEKQPGIVLNTKLSEIKSAIESAIERPEMDRAFVELLAPMLIDIKHKMTLMPSTKNLRA